MSNKISLAFDEPLANSVDTQIEKLQKITDYEIREWPIEVLVDKFTNGRETDESEIFIPDYQREMVWSAKQQSRFIESILIKLPVPFIFAADINKGPRKGSLEVIDGSQRLRTLDNFLSNRLTLQDLNRLTSGNGLKFSQLSRARQLRFKRSTIRVIELTEQVDEDARREMFGRLNSGGTKLTSMEIRRGTTNNEFMKFITECAQNEKFRNLVPLSDRNINRREYEELALRYFAYTESYTNFKKSVEDFLNKYLIDRGENFSKSQKKLMLTEFEQMLDFVKTNFPNGFLRSGYTTVPRIRFEVIAVGSTLALRQKSRLAAENITNWLDSKEFIQHTRSDASNSRPKLINRIHYVRDHLLGIKYSPDQETAAVEASANAEAPPDEEEDTAPQQEISE